MPEERSPLIQNLGVTEEKDKSMSRVNHNHMDAVVIVMSFFFVCFCFAECFKEFSSRPGVQTMGLMAGTGTAVGGTGIAELGCQLL